MDGSTDDGSAVVDRVRAWVRGRPILSVGLTAAAFLVAGAAIGFSDTQNEEVGGLEAEVSALEAEVSDLESDLDDAEDSEREASELADELRDQNDRLSTRVDRMRERAPDQEDPVDADEVSNGGSGTTVGDFTFSDVQVREDFGGDFEVRARVTNNGGAVEFVEMQATLFNGGKVVADLTALEDFDAGQTRTVTMTGLDNYGAWDDIEFTVDGGF